jgi:hypothetical protein
MKKADLPLSDPPRTDLPLSVLMDEVHRSLRKGEFGDLERLTAAMEAAEADLYRASPEEIRRLRRLAERNARTLIAARHGIKAARRRIAEVMAAARGLVTYDRAGHRVEESDARTLAKRF